MRAAAALPALLLLPRDPRPAAAACTGGCTQTDTHSSCGCLGICCCCDLGDPQECSSCEAPSPFGYCDGTCTTPFVPPPSTAAPAAAPTAAPAAAPTAAPTAAPRRATMAPTRANVATAPPVGAPPPATHTAAPRSATPWSWTAAPWSWAAAPPSTTPTSAPTNHTAPPPDDDDEWRWVGMIAGAGGAAAAAGAAVWGTGAYRHRRGDTALDRIRRVCSSPLLATPQVRTMVLGPSSGEEADAAADPPKPGETLAAATLGGRGGSVRSSVSPGRSYVSGSGGSGSAATPLLHAAEPSSDVTVAQPMAPMPSPLLGAGDAAGGGGGDDESEQEEMTISSSSAACATGAPALPRIAAWLDCAVREDERRLIWERIVAVLGADARGVRLLRRAKDGWTHDPYPSDRVVAVRDAVLQACTAPVVTGGVDDGGVESVTTRDDGLYVNFHEGVRLSLGQKYVIVSRYRQKISRRKRENMRVTLVDDAYRAQEGGETEAATC